MGNNRLLAGFISILQLLLVFSDVSARTSAENVKWLAEPRFSSGMNFSEGMAVVTRDGRYGYINEKGEVVIDLKYDSALNFSEGAASVEINKKYGLINTKGEIIIEPQFEWIGGFSEGFASFKAGNLYGFIGRDGKILIKPQFENVKSFSEGYASVQIDGKWCRINRNGEFIHEPAGLATDPRDLGFDEKYGISFHDNRALVSRKSQYGFIDIYGKIAVPLKYYRASSFSEGYSSVQTYSKTGYINIKGKMEIDEQYSEGADFSEGLARVVIDYKSNKWGFINKTGKLEIDASRFDLIRWNIIDENRNFSEGLFPVRENGMWGYIDRKGKVVIEPQFESAKNFSEGFALVSKSGKYGYIKNPLIIKDTIDSFSHGGQQVGEIKSVTGNEILISGTDIGRKVFIGDKLCVSSNNELILLSSSFPMLTMIKCDIISGNRNMLKKGLKVYKYKKRKGDDR